MFRVILKNILRKIQKDYSHKKLVIEPLKMLPLPKETSLLDYKHVGADKDSFHELSDF